MKSKFARVIGILALLAFLLLLVGCSSPLEESDVIGDYGSFYCDSDGFVGMNNDGGLYISIDWEITDATEHRLKFSYYITDENLMSFQEDNWDEYGWYEISEDEIWDNLDYLSETYNIPPEGYYIYDKKDEKLISEDYDIEYFKKN